MKRLFESPTFSFDYDEEKSLCYQHWGGETDNEGYKRDMLIFKDLALQLPRIDSCIIYPNLSFSITPELQTWTHENVSLPMADKFIRKCALIVPQFVFEQLNVEFMSVEQLLDENPNATQARYFLSEEDAFSWFGEKKST